MERYKRKYLKENSGYYNDFIGWCKLNKISKPELKDIDAFVVYRGITDFNVIQSISSEMEKGMDLLMPNFVKVS